MSQAQIFKADQRGHVETDIFRRLSTFNFGEYYEDSRKPFGVLEVFNEETLGGRNKIFRHVEENTEIILLPLLGGLHYRDSNGIEAIIDVEELRIFSAKKGDNYELRNPYEKNLIQYLQIWLRLPEGDIQTQSEQQSFDFSKKNSLIPIFTAVNADDILKSHAQSEAYIGIYEGRKEDTYTLKNPENGLFVFVINGAFELANRLLEAKDSLSLLGFSSIEFEALSENAILLILEVPIKK